MRQQGGSSCSSAPAPQRWPPGPCGSQTPACLQRAASEGSSSRSEGRLEPATAAAAELPAPTGPCTGCHAPLLVQPPGAGATSGACRALQHAPCLQRHPAPQRAPHPTLPRYDTMSVSSPVCTASYAISTAASLLLCVCPDSSSPNIASCGAGVGAGGAADSEWWHGSGGPQCAAMQQSPLATQQRRRQRAADQHQQHPAAAASTRLHGVQQLGNLLGHALRVGFKGQPHEGLVAVAHQRRRVLGLQLGQQPARHPGGQPRGEHVSGCAGCGSGRRGGTARVRRWARQAAAAARQLGLRSLRRAACHMASPTRQGALGDGACPPRLTRVSPLPQAKLGAPTNRHARCVAPDEP